jgi:hypothetical protein
MIAISIRNENASDVSTVTIIEVRDSEGFTTYLSWQSVMIEQDGQKQKSGFRGYQNVQMIITYYEHLASQDLRIPESSPSPVSASYIKVSCFELAILNLIDSIHGMQNVPFIFVES